jgi:hypothetical protein
LDDVFLCRPLQLRHSKLVALLIVQVSVVLQVPVIDVFIEPVKPLRSPPHQQISH